MAYILSIIANPSSPVIDMPLRKRISGLFPKSEIQELADGIAYDLAVADHDAIHHARRSLAGFPVDVNIVPAHNLRKKLLIADMDSTIIQQECIDELADFAGKRTEISAITERAMRGELDFEAALKDRVAMLKGVPESALAETFERRITLTPGARILVQTMNKMGAVTALVSGGFTFFTDRVAAATGFYATQANDLRICNGVLTGAVTEPILGRTAKQNALQSMANDKAIALDQTLAVGDGANDLSMLLSAGLGVAYHAKPAVAEAAHTRIDNGDLTALLYLQGVKMSEFTLT